MSSPRTCTLVALCQVSLSIWTIDDKVSCIWENSAVCCGLSKIKREDSRERHLLEGALRLPMTYDNHPIHPYNPIHIWHWRRPLIIDWSESTSNDLQWPIHGYFWLFIAISGYFWLLLAISDYFWPQIDPSQPPMTRGAGARRCNFWYIVLDDHWSKHRKNCECCPGHYLSTSVY